MEAIVNHPSSIVNARVEASAFFQAGRRLLGLAFFNLFIVSLLGVLLRAFPFLEGLPFQYKNLLHGHSHLAFGGWVLPALAGAILLYFREAQSVALRHWNILTVLLAVSAWGMLLTFPLQGYKAGSIFFSTLSVAAGFYQAVLLWKPLGRNRSAASACWLRAGLAYGVLSAMGPFATGPLIALGQAGSPLYYNAIYFYL
ncbi:MAG TPA: hypothetical protein VHK69_10185, partial [Chitinophagaceae bacterium]|nr:hypothetical protein [Chitinophagaceae bacterium]